MYLCEQYIRNGIIFRYIITIISLYILFLYQNNNIINKYLYLILPILLIILDSTDNIFNFYYKINNCTKTFYYQYLDKICDYISYILLFYFFKLDNLLLYFGLYRLRGCIIFYLTKKSIWLIVFFDFIKEYLLYIFLFENNYIYLPFFIVCKIVFEYYLHNIINKPHY
jgi:hypothetical protein